MTEQERQEGLDQIAKRWDGLRQPRTKLALTPHLEQSLADIGRTAELLQRLLDIDLIPEDTELRSETEGLLAELNAKYALNEDEYL